MHSVASAVRDREQQGLLDWTGGKKHLSEGQTFKHSPGVEPARCLPEQGRSKLKEGAGIAAPNLPRLYEHEFLPNVDSSPSLQRSVLSLDIGLYLM